MDGTDEEVRMQICVCNMLLCCVFHLCLLPASNSQLASKCHVISAVRSFAHAFVWDLSDASRFMGRYLGIIRHAAERTKRVW